MIRIQPDFARGAGQDLGRYLRIFAACGVYRRAAKGSDLPKSSEKSASVSLDKRGTPSRLSTRLWRYHLCYFRPVFRNV